MRALTPGATFAGRYEVVEELGHGGMGRVYKVFDTEVREKLALKLLNPGIADAGTIERFRNELRLARTVSHRNICRMHDLGRDGATYFITMEYVPGEDLKSLIHRIGALPLGKAVSLVRQICDGLEEAHRVGVVHRDLKPQNVMIDREGNARVMDFGIARSVERKGITGANVMIGTPEYMSPEQVDGAEADTRSDIYALGIVLFEMLTGRPPFEGDTPLTVAVKQKTETPPDPRTLNAQVPDALARVVLTCLVKAPAGRYQTARELERALAEVHTGLPMTTTPLPLQRRATSKQITLRVPSKRIWIPALAALAVAAALLGWRLLRQPVSARPSIAVMGFRNQTGDAAFDYLQDTIPNLLITSLEQSGRFRVTTWQRLRDLVRQAGKAPSATFDEEAGFEICRRAGIDALAVGFYTKAGETFVTDVKVLDAATREPLQTAQSRGEGARSILATQIDEISRLVSRGFDRSLLTVEQPATSVVDVTTSSLEAYSLFLRGRDEYHRFLYAEARASLAEAVAIDPDFAAAHDSLSAVYCSVGDLKRCDESLRKAWSVVARASEKERLYIEARYASLIERDPTRQYRILRDLVEQYPAEKHAHYELSLYYDHRDMAAEAIAASQRALALDPNFGPSLNQLAYTYTRIGDYPQALAHFERYAAVAPNDPNPRDSIAELYLHMGRLDESERRYRALLEDTPDFFDSWKSLAYVSILKERYPDAERSIGEFVARSASFSEVTGAVAEFFEAFLDHFLGRWHRASRRFEALRELAGTKGTLAHVEATNKALGFVYTDLGEYDAAREAFERAHAAAAKLHPTSVAGVTAQRSTWQAWVDFRQGRVRPARASLQSVEPLLPQAASSVRFLADLMTAEMLLADGAVDAAVEAGRAIVPPPLESMTAPAIANGNVPFLKDVLARAYWKKGDLDRAAEEYVRLMTIDPESRVRSFIHPLYHYRLGKVLEEKADRDAARTEYGTFLEYWRDADQTHPELTDARRRLAALR